MAADRSALRVARFAHIATQIIKEKTPFFLGLRQPHTFVNVYPSQQGKRIIIRVMTSIEAILNCKWHIADLQMRLAQLKESSGLGSDAALASAEFVELLQHNLDSWEDRKKNAGGAPLTQGKRDPLAFGLPRCAPFSLA